MHGDSEALAFLTALFGHLPSGAGLQLWRKDTKKSYTYRSANAAAAIVETTSDSDVYVTAGMARYTGTPPSKQRLKANAVVGIPGVWADIDVNGGPEDKKGAAPDREAAMALAGALLEPTVLVNSGYGVQAWWLFEEPWTFSTEAEREQAKRIVQAFQSALRARAGFTLDATHDLSRLMRVPGAKNHKGDDKGYEPVDVTLIEDDGPRYTLESINEVCRGHMTAVREQITGERLGIDISPEAVPDGATFARIHSLESVDDDFAAVWKQAKTPATRDFGDDQSRWDMAMTSRLALVIDDDQQLANALIYYRSRTKGDNKALREDYVRRTIARARSGAPHPKEEERLREQRIDEAADELAEVNLGAPDRAKTMSLFNEICGGPEIAEFVQNGRDPDTARYKLILADGREVPLGGAAQLLNPNTFQAAFLTVTQHVIPPMKRGKWLKVIQALTKTATVIDREEDTRAARAKAWVIDYIDGALSSDRDGACMAGDPFEHDDHVFVHAGSMLHWLKRARQERILIADLRAMLDEAGFSRKTVSYVKDGGGASSRSYYYVHREELENAVA